MKFRRWRPEEPATFVLVDFRVSNFAFFASGCLVFSDWEFFGAANMSMSVRCRFKGLDADPDALEASCDALGAVDASRDEDAPFSTSAR